MVAKITKGKKVLIHIGMGKTGSSSIQNTLAKQTALSFDYPIVNLTGHQNIEVLFREYSNVGRGIKSRVGIEDYSTFKNNFEEKFLAQIEMGKNLVISAEYLFNFKKSEVVKLKEFLQEQGASLFKILLYVRSPEKFYLSAVQQRLKASFYFESPHEFKVTFCKNISNWVDVFGKENVEVREFSPAALVGEDVVKDFEFVCNQFFGGQQLLDSISENTSISALAMCLLQKYRHQIYFEEDNIFKSDSSLLIKLMQIVDEKYLFEMPKLRKCVATVILENHREEIQYLKTNFGVFSRLDSFSERKASEKVDGINPLIKNRKYTDITDILENAISEQDLLDYTIYTLSYSLDKNGHRR